MQNETIKQVTNEVINVTKLAEILKGITKSTFCHIVYMVDDKRSKVVKGKNQIQKLVKISHVALNHNYTNKVIKLSGDTSFVAEEMKGKTRICSTLIQSDSTNELMIDGKVLNDNVAKILGYFHNGNEITEEEAIVMKLWANSYYKPTEPKTMGRGIVSEENNFRIINTYLSRIKQIKLEGQWYDIAE